VNGDDAISKVLDYCNQKTYCLCFWLMAALPAHPTRAVVISDYLPGNRHAEQIIGVRRQG
jgi:hypothetical protein